jgi:hypothetical protein
MTVRKLILSTALIAACSLALKGQQLFPELKGYKMASDYPVYIPDDLWDYINGAADAYLALGFIDLNISEYVKGREVIKAEIYRFGDDAEAFGIYSMERSPGYSFIPVGVQGYREEGLVHFYKDRYYIKIMTHSRSRKAGEKMEELARLIDDRIEGSNKFPELLNLFPAEGRLANEETYLLESVLGHGYLRNAFRATYEVSGERFDIYLFRCSDSDEAAAMASKLAGDSFMPGDEVFKYAFEDGFNGVLHLARQGSRLIVVSGLGFDQTTLAESYITRMVGL